LVISGFLFSPVGQGPGELQRLRPGTVRCRGRNDTFPATCLRGEVLLFSRITGHWWELSASAQIRGQAASSTPSIHRRVLAYDSSHSQANLMWWRILSTGRLATSLHLHSLLTVFLATDVL
jgi:hypothetical protein